MDINNSGINITGFLKKIVNNYIMVETINKNI